MAQSLFIFDIGPDGVVATHPQRAELPVLVAPVPQEQRAKNLNTLRPQLVVIGCMAVTDPGFAFDSSFPDSAVKNRMAKFAGLMNASYLGGMSNNVNGGQYVLYAVAAAVIGGTSLFGGRGRVMHGVVGGLVIGAIQNGMGLLGLSFQYQFIVTGIVLIVAVGIDALSRRGATAAGAVPA